MTCGYFSVSAMRSCVSPAAGDHLAEDVAPSCCGGNSALHAAAPARRCSAVMPTAAAKRMRRGRGEAVEIRVEQGGQDLAHAVGAEVEAQQAVAVLHAVIVADHGGHDELVGDALAIGAVHRGSRRRRMLAPSPSAIAQIGLLDALPALVAVHGEVAARDGGDRGRRRAARPARRAQVLGGRIAAACRGRR